MAALIHFYEDTERQFTWIGPKYVYEIVTNFVSTQDSLSQSVKYDFDYYRHNHYIDFSDKENVELYNFKNAIHDLFNLVDSGNIKLEPFYRTRAQISLGFMIELIVGALDFRGFIELDEPS